jgi:hypothetical protein
MVKSPEATVDRDPVSLSAVSTRHASSDFSVHSLLTSHSSTNAAAPRESPGPRRPPSEPGTIRGPPLPTPPASLSANFPGLYGQWAALAAAAAASPVLPGHFLPKMGSPGLGLGDDARSGKPEQPQFLSAVNLASLFVSVRVGVRRRRRHGRSQGDPRVQGPVDQVPRPRDGNGHHQVGKVLFSC